MAAHRFISDPVCGISRGFPIALLFLLLSLTSIFFDEFRRMVANDRHGRHVVRHEAIGAHDGA